MTTKLYVDKTTGTFADQLLAFGLAVLVQDVLQRAYGDQRLSLVLSDVGGYYLLDLGASLDDQALARAASPYAPVPVIVTPKNAEGMPPGLPPSAVVDYDQEKKRRAEYLEMRKNLPSEARRALAGGAPHPAAEALKGLEPHRHWDIFRAINPGAIASYNKAALQWWQVQDGLPQVVALLRDLFAQTPNDVDTAMAAWKRLDKAKGWGIAATVTAGQLYNPSQGKGQNRPKSDRLAMGNMDGFWLLEWLKSLGFYRAALTRALRSKDPRNKDRKTYVLAPANLTLSEHSQVFDEFRKSMIRQDTPVLSDILVSLRYTRALLGHTREDAGRELLARLSRAQRPRRVVAGFASAFYKDLGNSSATMNLPFVGLPGWLSISSAQDVTDGLKVIEEHEGIVRQLDESHGDEYTLALSYRDFCSGDDLDAFFDFAAQYSGYLMGRRERGLYARQFSEDNLGRLVMGSDPKLKPILDSPGFQHIAYAIRQSTVIAQYRAKRLGDRRYDVRYGLGQQLTRKAHYAQEFVAELSDFLQKYNAENAQVMETRQGPYRRSIKTDDIQDIVTLIDTYGSRTVCNLLVAYGYARTRNEGPDAPTGKPSEDITDNTVEESDDDADSNEQEE